MNNYDINKIIAPIELPRGDASIADWSEHLSGACSAKLLLFNAVRSEGADGKLHVSLHGEKINQLLKSAMTRLVALGKNLKKAHKIGFSVEMSDDWSALTRQADAEQADLLVAGLPPAGHSLPGRLTALMYNSPCPVLFVRPGMKPEPGGKILVPVRLSDGLEEKIPAVAALSRALKSPVLLSAFVADDSPASERLRLFKLRENMAQSLAEMGIVAGSETAHGYHFGTTMLERARQTGAGLMVIGVNPGNFISRLFNKMVGPFFLENTSVPVLSVPLHRDGRPQQPSTPPGRTVMPVYDGLFPLSPVRY